MKNIIFIIKTEYSEEKYFLEVDENDSIELQVDDALAEICYCDAYEIVSYKEVNAELDVVNCSKCKEIFEQLNENLRRM